MAEEIRSKIDSFNEILAALGFPYRVDIVHPSDPRPADKNARFMTGQQFSQLSDNIKKDGGLTSAPLCWRGPTGIYHILSGHHRIEAAKAAGLEWILIFFTDGELSRQEQIAIQLSHNAIEGRDEPTLLRELWSELTALDLKVYSGLDDQIMKSFEPIKIDTLGEKNVGFEEIILNFFPSEIERVNVVFDEIKKRKKTRYAAQIEQFDRFIDRLMDFKEASQIYNSATAVLAILDIVEEWLEARAKHGNEDDEGVVIGESPNGKAA